MVKKWLLFLGLTLGIFAENIYEKNCVPCHAALPKTLQQMFKRYLLVYSGEENVKASMKHYMCYPHKGISVMSNLFTDIYGIKKKSKLSKRELDEAIEIYWEKFKVFDKLE